MEKKVASAIVNFALAIAKVQWKDAGVAERGGLENRYTGNCIQGSNPCLSAKQRNTADNSSVRCFAVFCP